MKKLSISLTMITAAFFSLNAHATSRSSTLNTSYGRPKCSSPSVDASNKKGSKYPQFTATINCTLALDKPITTALSDVVLSYMKSNTNFKIASIQSNAVYKGREGLKLSAMENRNTGHGILNVSSTTYIVSSDTNTLLWESLSNRIDGTGDAKYTKHEQRTVEIKNLTSTSTNFIISKIVEIKKPMFAPSSMFENGVERGLSVDMQAEAEEVAKMLTAESC